MSKVLVIKDVDFSDNALDTIQFDVVHCTSISLDQSTLSFDEITDSYQLVASVLPADCGEDILWRSSNPSCCIVNGTGLVTVVGCGSSTITARCGQYTATCAVTVEIELTNYGRYVKSVAWPANAGDTNDVSAIYSLYNHSYASYTEYMLMTSLDPTQERLAIDFQIIKYDSETHQYYIPNPLPAAGPDDGSSRRIGYCVPILLPPNCTKVRCEAPADHYGAWVLFYSSDTPASLDTPHYALCAHRFSESTNESTHVWDYSSRTTEFDVRSGADSISVSWKADTASGATSFKDMSEALLAQFKVVCC